MHQAITQEIKLLLSKSSFKEALSLFKHLNQISNINQITPSILPSLIKACSFTPSLFSFTFQLHSLILKTNLISHQITLNSLLSTYSKSCFNYAVKLFDSMPVKDSVTYNTMLNSYVQNKCFYKSMQMFKEMTSTDIEPKPELIAAILRACAQTRNLSFGKAIHAHCTVKSIINQCLLLNTSLIDMYAKCGDLHSGLTIFDLVEKRNVVSWTSTINGCVSNGKYDTSIHLFREMIREGVEANRTTIVVILPSIGETHALKLGKEIHGYIVKLGLEVVSKIISALINMYSKCQEVKLALQIFNRASERDVITWTSIMQATTKAGDVVQTFRLFDKMRRDEGIKLNYVIMLTLIDACVRFGSVNLGLSMLCLILKSGFLPNVILGNSLINMFGKCGSIESSNRVFSYMMPEKDIVSLSAMIQSYGLHGRGYDALKLLNKLWKMGFECDEYVLLSVLSACSHSGLAEEGKKMFQSMKRDYEDRIGIEHYACYVDLLGKCGKIEEACEIVNNMPMKKNSKILSSLISNCEKHGVFETGEKFANELIDMEPMNAANLALISMVYGEDGNWERREEIMRLICEGRLKKNMGCSMI